MNRLHRWYCQTDHWKQTTYSQVLPWALDGIDLGDEVLEVGPGPGVTTDWLRHRVPRLECLEIDAALADSLRSRLAATNVNVRCGDAAAMPYRCRGKPIPVFGPLRRACRKLKVGFACASAPEGGIFL